MESEWKSTTLGQCADWFSGGTPSKSNPEYWNGDIPWISAKDMKNFRIYDAEDYVTKEGARNGTRFARKNSILLLVRGMTLHTDVPICLAMRDVTFNQDVKAIQPISGVDANFLAYWLLAYKPLLLSSVDSASHGTGRLNTEVLKSLPIALPPANEQRAIAYILSTLDDKIELNRRLNETLEALAQALFQSWFVDFDPVRAKAEGRTPRSMDASTLALFPSAFDDSPLGPIPQGWSVEVLQELVTLQRKSINPANYPNETFDHYSLPAFDERQLPKPETGADIKSNKFVVPEESILLSKLNPRIPRVWWPVLTDVHRSICSTEFLVAVAKEITTRSYIYALFTSHAFQEKLASLVTGTSSSHQRVNAQYVLSIQVIVPPSPVMRAFSTCVQPFFERIGQNLQESLTLSAMRDALLPNLLSGETRVAEAEEYVEAMQ